MINSTNFSVFQRLLVMMPFHLFRFSSLATLVSRVAASIASPHSYCLVRGFLFLLAGTSFLVLTACAGGGGSGSSSGGSSLRPLEVNLTFAPISGGFRIGNQSDFGDMVSLNIKATSRSGSVVEEPNIDIAAFIDDSSHDFTGLADLDWKFQIIGTLSDGRRREVDIGFVWDENEADNARGGIRSGLDTDGDRRADSVDEDDDNDGLNDNDGREQQTNSDDVSCSLLVDCDGDGEMDVTDIDDDGNGLIEIGTAEELDGVRYALNGSGRKLSASADLNTDGCGGNGGITSCSGYELVADISLANYRVGDGWQPLGNDTDTYIENLGSNGCRGTRFEGTFEGNGWTISDLNISRPNEDCVGLFGQLDSGARIRNLTLRAETVIGGIEKVGALVGWGVGTQISSVSVVVAEVRGNIEVGGLIGAGGSARILSSSVVAGNVSGNEDVGGLMGQGISSYVHSSSVVAGEVSGNIRVGGLVGDYYESGRGRRGSAQIISSSAVVGQVHGTGNRVGGLIGEGTSFEMVSSFVVVGSVSGNEEVGGMMGFFANSTLTSSYAITGPISGSGNIGGIIGVIGENTDILSSYWDSETSGIGTGTYGTPQTSSALQSPIDYTGIYDTWDDEIDVDNEENDNNITTGTDSITRWCDRDNSGTVETDEQMDDNLIWDFGTSSQYPVVRCVPISRAEWRDWWSLNGTGQPQLNQMRLDEVLNQ